ncbi:hypothetical protein [Streptomyces tropicalis]|uniref:Uncharacterized protein n=1 Tax=Streptomyces tropicalis TaxID=3034234 RepID=A0ABT6A9R0_9ACTN|nr:hypothetical protein [Streptomyces tropicalis]MDF3301390.1 hypothetical protein [Streptomyces tropicalis]
MTEMTGNTRDEGRSIAMERLLEDLARGCPTPPEHEVRPAYQPVEVQSQARWPHRGTVVGWWSGPDGVTACRLRLSGLPAPRWVVFDADRIVVLVTDGT